MKEINSSDSKTVFQFCEQTRIKISNKCTNNEEQLFAMLMTKQMLKFKTMLGIATEAVI
jgi:hypothetical protein